MCGLVLGIQSHQLFIVFLDVNLYTMSSYLGPVCNPNMSVCGPPEWFLVFSLGALCIDVNGVSELITFKLCINKISEPRSKPSVSFDKYCIDILKSM